MCKYCNVNEYEDIWFGTKKELVVGDAPYTTLSIEYSPKENEFTMVAEGDSRATMQLEYCPKCGRKLTENKIFKR